MCPIALIDSYLILCKKLGHNLDDDYIFPNVGAKFLLIVIVNYSIVHLLIEPCEGEERD